MSNVQKTKIEIINSQESIILDLDSIMNSRFNRFKIRFKIIPTSTPRRKNVSL